MRQDLGNKLVGALLAAALAGLGGCTSYITAKEVTGKSSADGMRYYLPAPYLVISHLPNDTWDANLTTVVDKSRVYAVQPHAIFAKANFNLENNPDGTIKSFKLVSDSTVVASASIAAAKDIELKKMELRQAELDRMIAAATKPASNSASGSGGSGNGGTAGSGGGGGGGGNRGDGATGAGTGTGATGSGNRSGGANGAGNAIDGATGAGTGTGATGSGNRSGGANGAGTGATGSGNGSATQKSGTPENATERTFLDHDPRGVVIYKIEGSRLVLASQSSISVSAPVVVTKYDLKEAASSPKPQTFGGIEWAGKIRLDVDVVQKVFKVASTDKPWNADDKNLFDFFTSVGPNDQPGAPLLPAKAGEIVSKIGFDPADHTFSLPFESLQSAGVKFIVVETK